MQNKKYLIVSVHDVSPAFEPEMKVILRELNKLKIKKSLLLVPDYDFKYPLLKHKSFTDMVKENMTKGDEIVLHGFNHRNDKDFFSRVFYFIPFGVNEFKKISARQAETFFIEGKRLLNKIFNVNPNGFIAPNWSMSKDIKKILPKYFDYYTTRNSIIFKDSRINSLVYGFCAGNNFLIRFFVKWFSYLRLKLFPFKIIRFVIHPEEYKIINWEIKMIKGLLKKGYIPVTFSELRNCK